MGGAAGGSYSSISALRRPAVLYMVGGIDGTEKQKLLAGAWWHTINHCEVATGRADLTIPHGQP